MFIDYVVGAVVVFVVVVVIVVWVVVCVVVDVMTWAWIIVKRVAMSCLI